jgi:hypothetical protein
LSLLFIAGAAAVRAQTTPPQPLNKIKLADVRMRDVCILADETTKTLLRSFINLCAGE